MIINPHDDLEERRILGLIDDDMYYMLKIRDAAFNCDVNEQKRLMHLRYLEKRQKEKKEAEEREKQRQEKAKAQKEQEKMIKDAVEKDLPKQIEKEIQKIFSKH